ncbi:Clavaminate synthase-like protein, partial [Coprinellus micaceus]
LRLFSRFQSLHSKQPFIVADYARDWPALNEHPWRRASYLRSVSGPGRVVPVEVGNNYLLETWKQVIMSWDSFLASLEFEDQEPSGGGELFYLAQHDLFMQMPALQDDFTVPDYAYASLVSDGRTHVPPSNENQLVINSWLGPRGTVSPPHTDPYHNLYVQVVGHKTVWLAPPTEAITAAMSSKESSTLQNTSRYDVFADSVGPELISTVVPHAMSATLKPGDMLFFPAGWWHAMRSESTSFSVSFWF